MLNQLFTANTSNLTHLTFSKKCDSVAPIIRGRTVSQIIYIANQVIAGSSATVYAAFKPSILNNALTLYNQVFDGCRDCKKITCFDAVIDDDSIILTTENGLADPGLFIGLNVFIAVMVLLLIAITICAWYYRRTKTKKQVRFMRS